MKSILLGLGAIITLLIVIVVGAVLLTRFADGPKGPIPGGALTSGDLGDATTVDWGAVLGDKPVAEIEMQSESPIRSRTTGAFVYEGALYVPCDLGYVWRRLPMGVARVLLHSIWLLKDWHTNALVDDRVVVRVQGIRYKLSAVRITDEALMGLFRQRVSTAAENYMTLLDVPTDTADIWFFRLDPR